MYVLGSVKSRPIEKKGIAKYCGVCLFSTTL